MEFESYWVVFITLFLGAVLALYGMLKRANEWYYATRLGEKWYSLPPGDLGWPLVGNMIPFLKASKSSNPESFISSYVDRYTRTGIYKAFMFGRPCILVTIPETCRQVLTDNVKFAPGWPKHILALIGSPSYGQYQLRRITAAMINGHESLEQYLKYIEDTIISELEEWVNMGPIEFSTQLRKLTFKIISHIFLGSQQNHLVEALDQEYKTLNRGFTSLPINIRGFGFYNAIKAKKTIGVTLQAILDEIKEKRAITSSPMKYMVDVLMEFKDETGRKLDDEEIIDVLMMLVNAGYESPGHLMMWVTIFLQSNPECLKKAKAEQEEISRNRPSTQKGLTFKEIRQMEYLSKVINETLRIINLATSVFREAVCDVNLNGYTIPKGWRVMVVLSNVHLDPEVYPNPKEFNPSRWDGNPPKIGSFIPFGTGNRMCTGTDLAKLESSIFFHHFLLNYELERLNPDSAVKYLPHPRPEDNCLARIKRISTTSV